MLMQCVDSDACIACVIHCFLFKFGSCLLCFVRYVLVVFFFFQAEDGIRDVAVTGVQTCALPISFVGRAGKLLTQMIEAMGLERQDVYICNVVKCRPPENRTPEDDEVSTCSPFLLRQLEVISPKVIVCLGAVAAKTLLRTNRGISQFRGQWLDYRGSKLMATYHPAYLLRNPNAKGEVWKDLQKVMAVLGLQARKGKPA